MGAEEPAGRERSQREGEAAGRGDDERRRESYEKETENTSCSDLWEISLLAISKFLLVLQQLQPQATAWKQGKMKEKEEVGEGPSLAKPAGCETHSTNWLSALSYCSLPLPWQ